MYASVSLNPVLAIIYLQKKKEEESFIRILYRAVMFMQIYGELTLEKIH